MGSLAVPPLIEVLEEVSPRKFDVYPARSPAMKALEEIGPAAKAAVPILLKIMMNKESSGYACHRAACAIAAIDPTVPEIIPLLRQTLEEGFPDLRKEAASALQRIKTPEAEEIVNRYRQRQQQQRPQ